MTFAQQIQDALSEQAANEIMRSKWEDIDDRWHFLQSNTERAAWLLAAVNNLAVLNATH